MHLPNLVVVVVAVENKDFSVLYRKTVHFARSPAVVVLYKRSLCVRFSEVDHNMHVRVDFLATQGLPQQFPDTIVHQLVRRLGCHRLTDIAPNSVSHVRTHIHTHDPQLPCAIGFTLISYIPTLLQDSQQLTVHPKRQQQTAPCQRRPSVLFVGTALAASMASLFHDTRNVTATRHASTLRYMQHQATQKKQKPIPRFTSSHSFADLLPTSSAIGIACATMSL